MRTLLRLVAGINALFQGMVGIVSMAGPALSANLFEVEGLGPSSLALIRMFGGLLTGSALFSAVIAKDPDVGSILRVTYAVTCTVNLAADSLVIASRAMGFSQLGPGMLLQVVLVVAIARYQRRT